MTFLPSTSKNVTTQRQYEWHVIIANFWPKKACKFAVVYTVSSALPQHRWTRQNISLYTALRLGFCFLLWFTWRVSPTCNPLAFPMPFENARWIFFKNPLYTQCREKKKGVLKSATIKRHQTPTSTYTAAYNRADNNTFNTHTLSRPYRQQQAGFVQDNGANKQPAIHSVHSLYTGITHTFGYLFLRSISIFLTQKVAGFHW